MKPGTLVMKIGVGKPDGFHRVTIPIGTIGEVKPDWAPDTMFANHVIVHFPAYPSWDVSECWQADVSLLMPINDPDMDITETEEEDLGEFV